MNVPVACAASIGAGFLAAVASHILARTRLRHDAGARFLLWFATLLALALVAPAVLASGAVRDLRVPAVARQSMQAPTPPLSTVAAAFGTAASGVAHSLSARPERVEVTAPRAPAQRNLLGVFGWLWLSGFAVSMLRVAFGVVRVRRIKDQSVLSCVRATPRGPVHVRISDRFAVPIAVGYRHPAVVLPRSMLALESKTDLENVLLHEIEHLRRFDDVTALVQAVCLSAVWFNPFARYIARCAGAEREMACDEAVVARIGKRGKYAATLWKIASAASPLHSPALLSAFGSGSNTVRRLRNLLEKPAASGRLQRQHNVALAAALPLALLGAALVMPAIAIARSPVTAFASVQLCCGESLIVGGRRADGSAVSAAQLYDAHGVRIAVLSMPVARWSAQATRLQNGDVLITGGMTPGGATADAEIYHAKTRAFERIAPMKVPRAGHSATVLQNGDVLIASGERADGVFVAQTEIFSVREHRFRYTADGVGRVGQTALLIDTGDVLMFGGKSERGPSRCAIIYDAKRGFYRTAGTLVAVGAHTLAFRLRDGRILTHLIRA